MMSNNVESTRLHNTSSSYQKILVAAKKLFWKYGIEKVQIKNICDEADVSKMSLYRAFNNKYHIAKEILEFETNVGVRSFRKIMDDQDLDFASKMQKVFEFQQKQNANITSELVNDLYSSNPNVKEIRALLDKYNNYILEEMKGYLTIALKKGEINNKLSVDLIIYLIDLIGKQMDDPNFKNLFDSAIDMNNQIYELLYYGVLNRET